MQKMALILPVEVQPEQPADGELVGRRVVQQVHRRHTIGECTSPDAVSAGLPATAAAKGSSPPSADGMRPNINNRIAEASTVQSIYYHN